MTTWKVYDREDGVRLRAKLGATADVQPADEDFFLAPRDAVLLAPGHKAGETIVISIRAVRKPEAAPVAEPVAEPPVQVADSVVAEFEQPETVATSEPVIMAAEPPAPEPAQEAVAQGIVPQQKVEASTDSADRRNVEHVPEIAPAPVEVAREPAPESPSVTTVVNEVPQKQPISTKATETRRAEAAATQPEPVGPPKDSATPETVREPPAVEPPAHYVASGFLGLSDELGEDEPEAEVKKPWWKRILPDFKR